MEGAGIVSCSKNLVKILLLIYLVDWNNVIINVAAQSNADSNSTTPILTLESNNVNTVNTTATTLEPNNSSTTNTSITPSSTEGPLKVEEKVKFDPATLNTTFSDCSLRCKLEPGCLGVTIYRAFKNNGSSNSTSGEGSTSPPVVELVEEDVFWCVADLSHSTEDLSRGHVVYTVMLREKLPKFSPLPYIRSKRQAPNPNEIVNVKPAEVHNNSQVESPATEPLHTGPGQVTIIKEVQNRFEALPPQKTLQIEVPNSPLLPNATVFPGELSPGATIASPPPAAELPSQSVQPGQVTISPQQQQQQPPPQEVPSVIVGQGPTQGTIVTIPASDIRILNNNQNVGVHILPESVENVSFPIPAPESTSIPIPSLINTAPVSASASASAAGGVVSPAAISIIVPGYGGGSGASVKTAGENSLDKNKFIVQIFPPTEIHQPTMIPVTSNNATVINNADISNVNKPIPGVLLSISEVQVPSGGMIQQQGQSQNQIINEVQQQPPQQQQQQVPIPSLVGNTSPETSNATITKSGAEGLTNENLEDQILRVRDLLNSTLTSVTFLLDNLSKNKVAPSESRQPLNESSFNISGVSIHKEGPTIVIDVETSGGDHSESSVASGIPEPPPSEQLEGANVENVESTEIPNDWPEVTVAPFPFLRPVSSGTSSPSSSSSSGTTEIVQEVPTPSAQERNEEEGSMTDGECVFSDRERFKRDVLTTTFSMVNHEPTMLTFINGSNCVGTFSKSGRKGLRSMQKVLPGFPYTEKQVVAGSYKQNSLYLFDSCEEQIVETFHYDEKLDSYLDEPKERLTSSQFLDKFCGIHDLPNVYVRALLRYTREESSCIVFDRDGNLHLSPNPSQGAQDLADSIIYVMEKEFVDRVVSLFAWLDEPMVNKVYLFGSNQEVYEIFRDESTNFKWLRGCYRIVPYEEFPYR